MKKKLFCSMMCVCLAVFLLCACASGNQGAGTIQKKNLAALVLADGCLVPGDGLEWHMSEDAFLSSSYGSEALDPESEAFEDFRTFTMENGWTSYWPETEVSLTDYKVSADMDCTFDADGGLIAVAYSVMTADDSAEDYADALSRLCAEADGMNSLRSSIGEDRDFTAEDVLNELVILQWADETNGLYFEINSVHFNGTLMLDLRVSTVDLRAPDLF